MEIKCSICNKVFTRHDSLNRHYECIHQIKKNPVSYDFNQFKNKCLDACNFSFQTLKDLRNHLENIHATKMDIETLQFQTFEDFNMWINDINSKNMQYIIYKKSKNDNLETVYYYCNRGGLYTPGVENRKRKMKMQGSCKLNRACTSSIIAKKMSSGVCLVTFYKTHYKHELEIQHLRIQKQERISIAHKLSSGIAISRILEDNRNKIDCTVLNRKYLILRKDINNIKHLFKIDIVNGVQHENDAISVDMWVEEYKKSCFVFYKKQGTEHPMLENKDFCLIFMNASQEHLLKTYGHNIVCLNSTHGLNSYDFDLTTIMVVDEFGEGIPGACMFSNRKDAFINKLFFEAVKERVGILTPATFMTDITQTFYNGWKMVMGEVPNQLFCSWHVDRAWKVNLNKISNLEVRQNVYKTLKYLQYLLDEDKFQNELQITIAKLCADDDTKHFGLYFQEHYVTNCKKWAYCFRKKCGINTNMRLESMHKTIKYYYLDGKKTKRLDRGIHSVVSYIRNKIIERLVKITKGKNSCHITDIEKRHHISEQTQYEVVFNENSWSLKANNSSESATYVVSKVQDSACCKLLCRSCNICVHTYKCTCTDYYIKSTICKHIHYILINNSKASHSSTLTVSTDTVLENNEELKIHLNTLGTAGNSIKYNVVTTNEIKEGCDKIKELVCLEGIDEDKLIYVKKTINTVINYLSTNTFNASSDLKVTTNEPANKKVEKQKCFYSTHKKRKIDKNYCSKPDSNENLNIENFLLNKPFVSTDINDHTYTDHNNC